MTEATGNLGERVRHLETLEAGRHHAKARSDAGQNISHAGINILVFEDEIYDTDGEYDPTTGVFTAEHTGWLHVTASVLFDASTTWAATEIVRLSVWIDGVLRDYLDLQTDFSAANIFVHARGSSTIRVAAGEVVTLRLYQDSGGALALYSTTSDYNYACFDWLA